MDDKWDDPVGTVHSLRPGLSTIYNGTGATEKFQRVEATPEQKAAETDGQPGMTREELLEALSGLRVVIDGREITTGVREYKRRARDTAPL